MGKFVTTLEIGFLEPEEITKRGLPEGETFGYLDADLIYVTSSGLTIVVPKKFISNFASVPRLFWNICPPIDTHYIKAAILHDWLYTNQGKIPGVSKVFSRKEVDDLFLEIMTLEETPVWKRKIMYYAVRFFGDSAWKSKETAQETYF